MRLDGGDCCRRREVDRKVGEGWILYLIDIYGRDSVVVIGSFCLKKGLGFFKYGSNSFVMESMYWLK